MEIDVKNIKAAYEIATESEKTLLSTLFPDLALGLTCKASDDRPVTERIKTFDDALLALGEKHPLVNEWHICKNLTPDMEAYLQLRVICAALNEKWEPQFTGDEKRWYPWHILWTESELAEKSDFWKADNHLLMIGDKYQSECAGLAFARSYNSPSYSIAYFGSRLCLKSEALATYCGKQFIDLWAAFMLKSKRDRIINH